MKLTAAAAFLRRTSTGPLASTNTNSMASYFCRRHQAICRLRTNAIPQQLQKPWTTRCFASDAQSNLQALLAREEGEEVESGNLELPTELADLKTDLEQDFRIVEDGATTSLFLKNSSSGNKVQISFHCQDTVEEELEEEEFDEEEEEEDEAASPVRFTVTVAKAGKTLTFSCLSDCGQTKIDGISTTSSSTPEAIHAEQGALSKDQYQGPDVLELAEDLQESLAVYLEEECGVDSDVASFVAMYTDYKEQQNYVQFLKDAQSIIS